MNAKRVERIWRREGLKVPQKQPKKGRLWLNDGSCIRHRPEHPRLEFPGAELGRSVTRETVDDEVVFTVRTRRLVEDGPPHSELAEALNVFVAANKVVLTESADGISVYQLNGVEADKLVGLFEEANWSQIVCRDEGGVIARHLIAGNGEGLNLTATRPAIPTGIEAVLTISGCP